MIQWMTRSANACPDVLVYLVKQQLGRRPFPSLIISECRTGVGDTLVTERLCVVRKFSARHFLSQRLIADTPTKHQSDRKSDLR
ncbi:hypothetical protein K239x_30590 [Planctomycetes bacterium K23_9]|uniref:Uncharacterized protein n=1 Tax=Stieleria marina TaxID=1930275 RepID=A0A517NVB6_9BACT|nr:hypothetical protein K239x_30590 [Planctomycetes bacterium K23_9]